LLLAITLAKSWAARAETATEPALAKEDCRRAVRLGRLILQDDVTLIANRIGLACVRYGATGHSRRRTGRHGGRPLRHAKRDVVGTRTATWSAREA
jgi:hypothetical protein